MAYFCAEFGLHNSVPIYSGGLGVLAGDHCKAASDLGVPMVGVGLFYMKGYFDQRLRLDGWQEDSDEEFDVSLTPLVPVTGAKQEPFLTTVETSGRPVHVRAWRMMVGRVPIYLLDTNLEVNHPDDRALMNKLYAGGPDMRLRQEWILGVGGVRVLRAMGIDPGVWHANEGHAAFMMVERLREYVHAGTAARRGRAPGPRPQRVHHAHAGAGGARRVLGRAARERGRAGVGGDGDRPRHVLPPRRASRTCPGQFHMTVTAMRLVGGRERRRRAATARSPATSGATSGPGRPWETVPIGHVTNGVHLATWMASPDHGACSTSTWARTGAAASTSPAFWDQVLTLDHQRFWEAHLRLKQILANFIREEARRRFADADEGGGPGGRRGHAARSRRRSPSASPAGSRPTSAPT